MSLTLVRSSGGRLTLPDRRLVLVDRGDGGNLVVHPTRPVWDRGELTGDQLVQWSFLVAAAARAMLERLPQLVGGCINYWDAGNWALNEAAVPAGPKQGPTHRRVHLHLLGRSPSAASPAWQWGEAPRFPSFQDRFAWAEGHRWLEPTESRAVATRTVELLESAYGVCGAEVGAPCSQCGYPDVAASAQCQACASG